MTTTVKVCGKGFECASLDFSCIRTCQMQLVVSAAGGIRMQLQAKVDSALVYVPISSLPLAYPLAQSQISCDCLSF